jgi:glycosyltransferase involved in cell wall biosynthesis
MRKKIGILLVNDDVGVAYYLLSIIKSLSFLNDDQQPEVLLLYTGNCKKYVDLYYYKYLTAIEIKYNENKKIKYLISIILRKNILIQPIINQYKLDGLFPVMDLPVRIDNNDCKIASWIPDFQHKFYPEFFSKKNLVLRETRFKQIIGNCNAVVLSSNDAFSHLKAFYKYEPGKTNMVVMPFVSMIKDFPITEYSELANKYHISTPYFLVSNQFYAHKNHVVVLNAIKELTKTNQSFTVFLTGKTEDYRNPQFFKTLTEFIEKNSLQKHAKILGLIPREDQLGLLKHALAIIQPSKFEGWSTIIEDAKTLQKQVICSDIDVHKEQMGERAFYFNMESSAELMTLMKTFLTVKDTSKPTFDNYTERVQQFAATFVSIF